MEISQTEFKRAIKLEQIFLPSASQQREKHYKHPQNEENPLAKFVHYTSAEAALRIIKNKRIWMRNTTCMADYREVTHGYEILHEIFHKTDKKRGLEEALDPLFPGATKEAISLFDQWWNHIQFNTFITSVSEHDATEDMHGRLSMWRAFRPNVARVAIVLKIPWSSEANQALNLVFSPVVYSPAGMVESEISTVIENIKKHSDFLRVEERSTIVGALFNMLRARTVCVKHQAFHEEREWRVIYSPKLRPSVLMESSTEVIEGIPQIVHKIPLVIKASGIPSDLDFSHLFDRLIIGPSPYPWVMYEAFTLALKEAGISDAGERVRTSDIPIRA